MCVIKPFLLNPWKHHAGFLKQFIKYNQHSHWLEINSNFSKMGNCMIDFYYGDLAIQELIMEVQRQLKSLNCYSRTSYGNFIKNSNGKFRNMQISDGSTWTLLLGNDQDRYIHLHSARGSDYTIRVGALALKTAIIIKLYYSANLKNSDLVVLTNEVRLKYLGESPIKNLAATRGINKALKLL